MPMATDDPIRASDADREAVVATLREAYTAGRLTLDEFDERMTAAYAGRTWGELRKVTIDLPSQPILGGDVPGRQLPPTAALPSHPARPAPPPDEVQGLPPTPPIRRRPRPLAILVPVAVWVLLAAHGVVGPGAVFLLIAVFALTTILSGIRRR
jgi:Domain of unknown function (DUF1707)